ncbi:MAG: SPL family radical SAM protein [Clostridiales bacterium]|jgi:spore photoproduct lyase
MLGKNIFRGDLNMFLPKTVYYEKESENYELGKELLQRYKDKGIQCIEIENHNNIEVMRKKQNSEFPQMKQNLIIGIRKTHKFVPNYKTSDFLVPYTSSGCIAMCLYCYLVCNYNKCAYLRLFVNREQMLNKIIKVANESDKNLTFEIGSNSDLILENTITNNLVWTIENFKDNPKGLLTFPTKFDMVDPILPLDHNGKVIVRMSVNPREIIKTIEIGTSPLENRVKAINKLKDAEYKLGILIAPVILVEDWKKQYTELIQYLAENLSERVKKDVFFEIIFMTYSYVHRMINQEAFPKQTNLYNQEIMTVRGKGKYTYNKETREEAEMFLRDLMRKYFPHNEIKYIV